MTLGAAATLFGAARWPPAAKLTADEPAVAEPAPGPLVAIPTGTPPAATPTGTRPAPAPTGTLSAATRDQQGKPVLRLPGPVPSAGRGTFAYAGGAGAVLGRSGALLRYRVAVEDGTGENMAAFAEAVDRTLGAPGGWTGGGGLRVQRVPGHASHDFTVYLATAGTARRMCADGGIDIRVGGRPYTSCRVPGRVIVNLDRWRLSVDHFVAAGIPLAVYRGYVLNHEVGHQLGHRHERCPGDGVPAPVMMQQTLSLRGCVANPWPYLRGRLHAGPPM